jgi:predicted transcriptional regulator
MKKTYSLPNDLVFEVERLAKQLEATQSSIIATAVATYLTLSKVAPGGARDLLRTVDKNQTTLFKQLKEFKP